jgi:hypothetical protein
MWFLVSSLYFFIVGHFRLYYVEVPIILLGTNIVVDLTIFYDWYNTNYDWDINWNSKDIKSTIGYCKQYK